MFNGDRSTKYPNTQDMVADGIPFINAGDLVGGHVNLETANKMIDWNKVRIVSL